MNIGINETVGRPALVEFKEELHKQQKEVGRLLQNWLTLLDAMPEMVFLVSENFTIEYINSSARKCFGDLRKKECSNDLKAIVATEREIFKLRKAGGNKNVVDEGMREGVVDGLAAEYTAVPFIGYLGERLLMLIVRDITLHKQHDREITNFHVNIEEILTQKIGELQESEEDRKCLSQQINSLRSQLEGSHGSDKMIGNSRKMRELREMIYQVARSDATILITGESGTGKELVANKIRENSNRGDESFLKINCNSINDSILESDLFGYEKGSFTGADKQKIGKFEIVDGGTIFLDEIGDISPRMQASLLRVLQNGEIIRVGGNVPVKVDVRVIAATNVDLVQAVREKRFRLDLFYRLNIININIPPLRERKEDIVDLVSYFVKYYREAFKKDIDFVPQQIINRLLEHDWPGNVRELENLIQRAVLMTKGKMITEQHLLFDRDTSSGQSEVNTFDFDGKLGNVSLKNMIAEIESDIIMLALEKSNGSVAKASQDLNIGKTALYDKMKRYDISAKAIKRVSAR